MTESVAATKGTTNILRNGSTSNDLSARKLAPTKLSNKLLEIAYVVTESMAFSGDTLGSDGR